MTTMTFTTTTRPAFSGCYTALITPFRNGELDIPALRMLVERQILGGVAGLVPCGTTGETPALTSREWETVVSTVVEATQRRVPVIAGTGSNGTASTIERTRRAQELGADAALVVTPYYNKPTQEGLYLHHKAVAEAVDIPQILYNVPGRTACDMLPETVLRLAAVPNIVGIKEATGDLARLDAIRRGCPPDFMLLSGDDATACSFILGGGHGVISVTANVAPKLMHEMCVSARRGDEAEARTLDARLQPLHRDLFVEANPIPVKWAVERMGLIDAGIRLPLTWLSAARQPVVRAALGHAGISCRA